MGLSNSPKQEFDSLMLIAEIAKGIATLGNEKDIEKLIKKVNGLSEVEEAKAKEARESIKKYESLIVEQKNRAADLEAEQDNIDLRKSDLEKIKAAQDARKADQDKIDITQKEEAKRLSDAGKELLKGQQELQAGQLKLERGNQDLEAAKQQFEQDKASLKEREDKLKALIG